MTEEEEKSLKLQIALLSRTVDTLVADVEEINNNFNDIINDRIDEKYHDLVNNLSVTAGKIQAEVKRLKNSLKPFKNGQEIAESLNRLDALVTSLKNINSETTKKIETHLTDHKTIEDEKNGVKKFLEKYKTALTWLIGTSIGILTILGFLHFIPKP
jgi:soluble cytochrome b562